MDTNERLNEKVGSVVVCLDDGTEFREPLSDEKVGAIHLSADGRAWLAVENDPQLEDHPLGHNHILWKGQAAVTQRRKYTLSEFMDSDLPPASKLIDDRLGSSFVGPFTRQANQLAVAYRLRMPELQGVFRKLDLLLASKDGPLIESARSIKSPSLKDLTAGGLHERLSLNPTRGIFALSNDEGWETVPHEPGGEDEFFKSAGPEQANEKSDASREGGDSSSSARLFSHCHEHVELVVGVRIPELDEVFREINFMLNAGESTTKGD